MRFYFIFVISILIQGCSTSLLVRSDPQDFEVYSISPETGEKKLIGKTPIEITSSDFKTLASAGAMSGNLVELVLEKPGYLSSRYLVPLPRLTFSKSVLVAKPPEATNAKVGSAAQEIVQYLYNSQKLINVKEYERAQIEIDKILKLEPNFPRALSLRGTVYFLQKNYPESLKWFEQALTYEPRMDDSLKMIAELRKILKTPDGKLK